MSSSEAYYMVTMDGRPFQRGMTHHQACAYAKQLAEGYEGHRSSDKRRIACFDVKLDTQAVERDNRLYRAAS